MAGQVSLTLNKGSTLFLFVNILVQKLGANDFVGCYTNNIKLTHESMQVEQSAHNSFALFH